MTQRKIINLIIILVAVIAVFFGFYFYYQLNNLKENQGVVIQKDLEDLLIKVGRLYLLPEEEPTIATVSDPEVLKGQSFFTNSKKDDKVLIFTRAGKAVLYRPSIDKIIEITSITQNTKPSTATNGPIGNENF